MSNTKVIEFSDSENDELLKHLMRKIEEKTMHPVQAWFTRDGHVGMLFKLGDYNERT